MKAVNLLPREARRGSGSLSDLGIGTTAVFAALGLALALVVAYVVLANGVTNRTHTLSDLQAQSAAAEQQVAKLKPYADLEQLRESLLDRVRTLAGGRYDWPTMLSRLARALPSDTTLTSFDGSPASAGSTAPAPAAAPPAAAAAGAAATTAPPAVGPTVALSGCTPSNDAVAGVIDRLRSVQGVASVTLQSSTVVTGGAGGPASGGCTGAEQFKLSIQLDAPAPPPAAPTTTPGAGTAAPGTTTPAPSTAATSPQASAGTGTGGNS